MQPDSSNSKLNEQQLHMLRLFKDPMPEADFLEMKRLAVQLLAKKLESTVEKWETENGVTAADYERLAQQHFRSSRKPAE